MAITLLVAACSPPITDGGQAASASERVADVARRGALVMPFDLAKTRHVFTKTPAGGLQRVEARDADDATQIELIREHLAEVAGGFRQGNFADPALIHGEDMPGLQELSAAAPGQVRIEVGDVPLGGVVEFRSNDTALVAALHRWFDAQLSDHGRDATSGHQHHGK